MRPDHYKALIRRTVEIDYRNKHRHLPSSLSALPIIAGLFNTMQPEDSFVLSKGHSCAALYAVLESRGLRPDCSKVHPERDPENGVTITAGSLGHGLPIAAGMAYARKISGKPGRVHVLLGDGECQEGTTWEALNMAARLKLQTVLFVHVDGNGRQGSDRILVDCGEAMQKIYRSVIWHTYAVGFGVKMFEENPGSSTHTVTDLEFANIMEELK